MPNISLFTIALLLAPVKYPNTGVKKILLEAGNAPEPLSFKPIRQNLMVSFEQSSK